MRARIVRLDAKRYELIATAANETDHAITTTMTYGCPGTVARFDGLPAAYDIGNRCQAGACPGGPTVRSPLSLPAGGAADVAHITLDIGAGACNSVLSPGRYSIGASLDLEGVHSCTTSRAILEAQAASAPTLTSADPSVRQKAPPHHEASTAPPNEKCPAMGCAYTPCPPGAPPPTGCAAVCGCPGERSGPATVQPPRVRP